MKKILLSAAVAAIALAPLSVRASDVTPTGGFNSGTTNPQSNFTATTSADGKFELALSAQARFPNTVVVTDNNNGTYFAQPGTNTSGSGLVGATWDFDFSIKKRPEMALARVSQQRRHYRHRPERRFQRNLTTPLTTPNDNYVGTGNEAPRIQKTCSSALFTPHTGTFNPNEGNTYFFTLSATESLAAGGTAALMDSITVDVAPLPSAATMGLGMLAVIGAPPVSSRKSSALPEHSPRFIENRPSRGNSRPGGFFFAPFKYRDGLFSSRPRTAAVPRTP